MAKVKKNTRAYEVTMTVYADSEATAADVRSMVYDLTWVGGHCDPDDPRFWCLDVTKLKIKRGVDRAAK